MSELSNRLRDAVEAYQKNEGVQNAYALCDLVSKNLEAIISALETVEGIEGLQKFDVRMERGDQPDDEWLIEVNLDSGEVQCEGPTLHAAVMAAAEKARNA